jgi:hypothetical protein
MRICLFVLLAACTTFEPVPRDVCGNGVLEPGEDCDSSDATCVHCAVTCSAATDCPTSAYACGVDGLCHAPGGAFGAPVEAGSFLVDDYTITDIDRDHIGDVVGQSRTSIVVRHGDSAGSLARSETTLTPSQTGPGAFGDVDNDGTTDVTITTPDGLVSYASTYGVLSPLDISSTISGTSGPLQGRMVFTITPATIGAFMVDSGGYVELGVVDFGNTNNVVGSPPCSLLTAANFHPELVDVYQVNADSTIAYDTVVAMVANGQLCVLEIHKDNILAQATVTDITPAGAPAITHRPVLADLDNDSDRCPDVVTTDNGVSALRHWPAAMASNRCAFGAGAVLPPITNAEPGAHVVGHATLTPNALALAPDALVLGDGVWAYNGSGWGQLYASTRPLAGVLNADLDGDGRTDIVLSGASGNDLDVLYRTADLLATFELYRVETATPVAQMDAADFDGDGVTDLEYVEPLAGHARMMIAYGDGKRFGTPVEVATFASVSSIAKLTTTSLTLGISDLIVLQNSGTSTTLSFLVGSPQRTMLAYFDPRPNNSQEALRTDVVGKFSGGTYRDVLAIASSSPGVMPSDVRAWPVAGPPTAYDGTKTPGTAITGVADCSHDGGTGFCAEDATYLAWPATGHDVVIGVDHPMAGAPLAAVIDPSTFAARPITAIAPPATSTVRSLYASDLDGNGTPELIAAFDGALYVCSVDSTGMPQQCDEISGTTGATCSDLAPAQVTFRDPSTAVGSGHDLVALCRDNTGSVLYRVTKQGTSYQATELVRSTRDLRGIRIGDVDGDGLDDVVAVAGDPGEQTLVVFRQCSSRELATCGGQP